MNQRFPFGDQGVGLLPLTQSLAPVQGHIPLRTPARRAMHAIAQSGGAEVKPWGFVFGLGQNLFKPWPAIQGTKRSWLLGFKHVNTKGQPTRMFRHHNIFLGASCECSVIVESQRVASAQPPQTKQLSQFESSKLPNPLRIMCDEARLLNWCIKQKSINSTQCWVNRHAPVNDVHRVLTSIIHSSQCQGPQCFQAPATGSNNYCCELCPLCPPPPQTPQCPWDKMDIPFLVLDVGNQKESLERGRVSP